MILKILARRAMLLRQHGRTLTYEGCMCWNKEGLLPTSNHDWPLQEPTGDRGWLLFIWTLGTVPRMERPPRFFDVDKSASWKNMAQELLRADIWTCDSLSIADEACVNEEWTILVPSRFISVLPAYKNDPIGRFY